MSDQAKVQPQPFAPTTTGILALLQVKPGVTRERVMAIMPAEIRATVRLYLAGRIREWYSRADGRGAVFLLAAKDAEEAEALMESLPLAREHLVDHQYIGVGPLVPLGLLLGGQPAAQ
jgi:hypothetical protein